MAGTIKGITIQLGADTTKLSSALNSANKAIKSTQNELKSVEKALKLDPGNAALLGDKFTLLKDKLQAAKDKLDALKQAQQQLDAAGVDKNSEEYQKLQREIDLATADVRELERQTQEFGSVGAQQVAAVGDKLKSIGDSVTSAGKTLTTRLTVPLVGIGGAAVKTAADFDSSMSNVQAISGATSDEMSDLEKKAREMGASTKFSATEAGDAMGYMAMAGWKSGQMIDGIEGIMNLAAASGEDLALTSDIVTDALTAFGLQAKDSSHFADVLAAASSNSNTNVSMLGESFKYVAPLAGSMGYSAEDTSIALGLMANAGIKASNSGTALRTILTNMAKPTDQMESAMRKLGLSLDDGEGNMYSLREIMDQLRTGFKDLKITDDEFGDSLGELNRQLESGEIDMDKYSDQVLDLIEEYGTAEGALQAQNAAMLAGKTGLSGLMAIVNASDDDYAKLTAAIDGASDAYAKLEDGSVVPMNEALASGQKIIEKYNGKAEATAKIMQDNLNGHVTELKSALQEAAISLGTALIPMIEKVVKKIKQWTDKFNSLDDKQKETIAKIGLVVAAIGPLLVVIGKMTTGIGSVLKLAPQITGAITKLSTVFGGAAGSASGFSGALAALTGPVGIAIAAIAGVVAVVTTLWKTNEDFRNTIKSIWGEVVKTFEQAQQKILGAINSLGFDFKSVTDVIKAAWVALCNIFAPIFEGAFKSLTTALRGFMDIIAGIIQVACGIIKRDWKAVWQGIVDIAKGIFNTLTAPIQGVLTTISKFFNVKMSDIKTLVSNALEAIKTFFTSKMEAVRALVDRVLTTIKNFFTERMTAIKDFISNTLEAIRNFFQSKMDAVKSIVDSVLATIRNFFTERMTAIRDFVSNALEAIRSFFQSKMDAVKSLVDSALTAIRNFFQSKMDAVKSLVDSALTAIKNFFSDKLNAAKSTVSSVMDGIKSTFSSALDALRSAADSILGGVKDKFTQVFDGIKSYLTPVIDWLKGIFNFEWKLPSIKLPHFHLEGEFNLEKGTVPHLSVDWYDKGGIFNSPTIIGVGEKRPEFVGALDDLRAIVREESGGGPLMKEMVRLMTIMVEQGGRPITVNQEIYADSTSYSEQQRQAAREFRNIARALT